MPFEPRQVPKGETVYRGIGSKGYLDRQTDPWGIKLGAFLRKKKDHDGLTVVLEVSLCFRLDICQIAKLEVAKIEGLTDRVSGEPLRVWQNAPDHAYIDNVPFHEDHPQEAQDLATDLTEIADLLTDKQFREAKEAWAVKRPEASENHPQE